MKSRVPDNPAGLASTVALPRKVVAPLGVSAAPITSALHPFIASEATGATSRPGNATAPSRFEHAAFVERDPRGFTRELQARGERDLTGDYRAKDESYELVVPAHLREGDTTGVLVWMSATPTGALPRQEYASVLSNHNLVWIGPNRAGNEREVATRLGLALDSVLAARRRVNVDPNRLFIGGMSGGAKTAFRALLYYPEVFRAALLSAGIEYIRDVPVQSRTGSLWPARIGQPSDLNLARIRPIAITTGSKDYNQPQIHDVAAALGQDRFSHVTIFDWPELAHEAPPAELFDRALTWLEDKAAHP